VIRETGHLPADIRRVARTQHDPTPIKEQTMSDQPATPTAPQQSASDRSARPVVEHALTDYGYSPDTARRLVDQLVAEGREQ
jgi:hypothetical protein